MDPQAVAIAHYLHAAGYSVDKVYVGIWLNFGTVVFLELAAALGLTVAAGLYPTTRQTRLEGPPAGENSGRPPLVPAAPETAATPEKTRPSDDNDDDNAPPPRPKGRPGRPASVLPAEAVAKLRKHGKANGIRGIAKVLGTSKSTAHRLIHQLAAAGQITLAAGRHGVSIALA